ncbi:hypothetical protein Asppvi_007107 [Aspergillus pseudoviridinutans]|uniref:FAD/NAD(P)-binding domain-containing protein n=1 Tax=Aspergillus pseudoviridinutans TaxID=1517512 RepID=A0A9P3BDU4_9EURO|nr:uncharacterized protein Asppvi_007107 [Aspergillus pseudoviridinutans]GIJ88189.1 hypothetical protein Asppvi_007107 [Aspergillus pseudoviridinutans]
MPADALIIGGGPAGLKAAWDLGRGHHRTILFSASSAPADKCDEQLNLSPRPGSKFFLEGPFGNSSFLDLAQEEIQQQASHVCIERRRIIRVKRLADGIFQAEDPDGNSWRGRLLILAHGSVEVFPGIAGYGNCWRQQRIQTIPPTQQLPGHVSARGVAILAVGELAELTTALRTIWRIRQYNSQVHVYTNGDHELAQALQTRKPPDTGITIEGKGILRLEPDISTSLGVVIYLLDGTATTEAFLYHCPTPQLCGPFARQLDLELAESGAIHVSARAPYMTSMDGVYAAGDCTSLDRRTLFNALSMGEGVAASVAARLEQEQWPDLESKID